MDDVTTRLRKGGLQDVSLWIQLGAGGQAEGWSALRRQGVSVTVVDGEAAALTRLRRTLPAASLVQTVVAREAGKQAWHVFNHARFNGLVGPACYTASHPRLQHLGSRSVAARGVSELLASLAPAEGLEAAAALLGVDLGPGGAAMLTAVDEAVLLRFGTVLLWHDAPNPEPDAAARLDSFSYRRRTQATATGGAVTVFELDQRRLQLRRLRDRNQALHAANQGLRLERRELASSLAAHKQALQHLRADRLALVHGQVQEAATLRAQRDALASEREQLLGQLQDAKKSAHQSALKTEALQIQRDDREAEHKLLLREVRRQLDRALSDRLNNSTRQVEAYLGLQSLLSGGPLLPPLHGWAVSADFAVHQLQRFSQGGFDLVVEFGSGSSTLLMARLRQQREQTGAPVPTVLSFDHSPDYCKRTRDMLAEAGVSTQARVVLAPLVNAPDGGTAFYSCEAALIEAAEHHGRDQRVLVIVDGPPSATGPLARRPALSAVLDHLGPGSLELLLDDYRRGDEVQVVQAWMQELQEHDYQADLIELPLEKQAAWVRASRLSLAPPTTPQVTQPV